MAIIKRFFTSLILILTLQLVCLSIPAAALNAGSTNPAIPIVLAETATSPECSAARDLAAMLGKIYPTTSFPLVQAPPASGRYIALGTPQSLPPALRQLLGAARP